MSETVYFGRVYVATALGDPYPAPGSSNLAAVTILGVPGDETKREGSKTRIITRTTTNPQAVALGILWAFQVLGDKRCGTVCTNLKAAEMLTPQAIRRVKHLKQYPPPADEDPRSFGALMDRIARYIESTIRNEVAWLPKAPEDPYFKRAAPPPSAPSRPTPLPPSTNTPR